MGLFCFAEAWGTALSDSYNGEPGRLDGLLYLLEAPVALIQWIVIRCHPQSHTGLGLAGLFLIAVVWSAGFGWISAVLYKHLR
jgi:hypothetical protein